MRTRRSVLGGLAASGTLLAGCLTDGAPADDGFSLTSPAFDDGEPIPSRYTCRGENVSPPLTVAGAPDPTAALALVCASPDSPGSQATYWLCWNLPPDTREIPAAVPRDPVVEELDDARQGTNDGGRTGYAGPCPPPGTEATYWFTLHALDSPLDLEAGAGRDAFDDALETHRLAGVILEGTYSRE
jgi:hypothetical protein